MKTALLFLTLLAADLGLGSPGFAQEAATLATVSEAVAVADSADQAAPTVDKGDVAWMLVSTILVLLMALPGLALFYGGMLRAKNALSVMTQVFAISSLIGVLWVVYGYSLAFTAGNPVIGSFDKLFLSGVTVDSLAATFTDGVALPELLFMLFQLTFAGLTAALIVGGLAERVKFSALLVFSALWFTLAYLPMVHMVWVEGGLMFDKGELDFAGGTVVHINAGVAALVGALVIGRRLGFGREHLAPHNLTLTLIGGALLWFGWFGFNAGSSLEANGIAVLAAVNTMLASMAGALAWMAMEWIVRGKPSLLGVVTGAIGGLVAITPAAGLAGPMGALVLGALGSLAALWAITALKARFGYDETLDVFGVHGVAGIVGAIGTGIVVSPALGGVGLDGYSMGAQVLTQMTGVGLVIVWSGLVSFVLFKLIDLVMGLRVSEEQEREGLDTSTHGEQAYKL